MEKWISKKELLAKTGISYGQLYRWKREKLIPDDWFIKRAAFTGQETFFPRERVLERISFILENKDRYALRELVEMLSPNPENRRYPAKALDTATRRPFQRPGAGAVRGRVEPRAGAMPAGGVWARARNARSRRKKPWTSRAAC